MRANVQDRSFDTDQLSRWRATIDELVCRSDLSAFSTRRFAAKLRQTTLGSVQVLEIVSESEHAVRTRRHISTDPNDNLVFVFVRSGDLCINQGGSEVRVGAGDFTIYNLTSPFTYSHPQWADVIVIKFPASYLISRVGKVGYFLGRPYSGRTGVGRLAVEFAAGLSRESRQIHQQAAVGCGYQVIELIGIALETGDERLPISDSVVKSALFRRCAAFIRSEIANPELDPELVADANGISVRYLHRIFQDAGQTVGEFLRQQRLERCHRDLSDPSKSAASIGEIALRAGFRNRSHFAKLFKDRFGISAADIRRAAGFVRD
jgi:AraC family transcriptional activator of tynA and feaB